MARLNAAPDDEALAALREVCASTAWAHALLARRPYATADDLLAAGDSATGELDGADLDEAMAGHPPIGRPRPGDPASAREQRGMADASDALRAEMLDLNLAYQERFGHVFLICATGASAEDMRDALRTRLGHPPEREREIARAELGRINRIRLARLATIVTDGTGHEPEEEEAVQEPEPLTEATGQEQSAAAPASVSTHILDTSLGRPAAGVPVTLAALGEGPGARWTALGGARTDGDGRCKELPALPAGTVRVRLDFETDPYLTAKNADGDDGSDDGGAPFFPEVTVAFRVRPGRHYHVPLLLNPFGYSVYRGS
ncbi:2-oxo-4-hydroxy-4-carboxy-5-ureidoimidazoline decarboxylase [Streptomyces paludis]|uniref:2-oxo-4-hydroxy-4-carboxy-5-ureidoimidazoline decarboxylase n=1 Tax=Streptomyces paludis TaxID=2282738 RepID=A0A345I203_9ACTN|nr:2-oxo-4-hydroxy-4-carboxy-5-ureidoimidazoline decarboxylase [Streptomyces paludis]